MHQDQCRAIARAAAFNCGERHDYMPSTVEAAAAFQPHRWVIDAMLRAAHEAEKQRDQYLNGNTELLGLLMKLHAGEHTAVLKRAREILASVHLIKPDGTLDWAALEARRPRPLQWSDAVNALITDPAARERLLALDDTSVECTFCHRKIVGSVEGPPCDSRETAERCDSYQSAADVARG